MRLFLFLNLLPRNETEREMIEPSKQPVRLGIGNSQAIGLEFGIGRKMYLYRMPHRRGDLGYGQAGAMACFCVSVSKAIRHALLPSSGSLCLWFLPSFLPF